MVASYRLVGPLSQGASVFVTVPPETHSDLIPWARKIEFESCK